MGGLSNVPATKLRVNTTCNISTREIDKNNIYFTFYFFD